MKKGIVLLTAGVLSLGLFSFKSGNGGTITVSDGGLYVCNGTHFTEEDDQVLSAISRAHEQEVLAAGYWTYQKETTTANTFTKWTYQGDDLINHQDEFLDAAELAQVKQIMSGYMED